MTVITTPSPRAGPAPATDAPACSLMPGVADAPRPLAGTPVAGVRRAWPSVATITMSASSGAMKAAAAKSPSASGTTGRPGLVASTSAGSSRFTAPDAVTITSLSALGPTRASTLSPRLAPRSRAALSPRARRVASGRSATGTARARPGLVTAAAAAAVDDISRAAIRSWRPGEASRAPAAGIRPRLPLVDRVTTQGSSAAGAPPAGEAGSAASRRSAMSDAATISDRRGAPWASTTRCSSDSTMVRCRCSLARIFS